MTMITAIALLTKHPLLTRDAFINYYENHHVPLVLSLAPAPASYTRSYPRPVPGHPAADFDVITCLQFHNRNEQDAWTALAQNPLVIQDEEVLFDRSAARGWIVDHRG